MYIITPVYLADTKDQVHALLEQVYVKASNSNLTAVRHWISRWTLSSI